MGFIEQISSGSPSTFREAGRRPPPSFLSSLSIIVVQQLPCPCRALRRAQARRPVNATDRYLSISTAIEHLSVSVVAPRLSCCYNGRMRQTLFVHPDSPCSRVTHVEVE